MVHRIEGVYRDGRVELTQAPPEGVGETRVIVVFLPGDDGHVFAEQSIARGAADDLGNAVVDNDERDEDTRDIPLATAVVPAIPLDVSEPTEAPALSPPPLPPAFQPLAPANTLTVESEEGILDYASPRQRPGATRLPAQSRLEVHRARDRTDVLEYLTGRGLTVGILICSGFVTLVLVMTALMLLRERPSHPGQAAFLLILVVVEVSLILAVVNNTWRRTVLTVQKGVGGLHLTFTAPFTRRREFKWPLEQIEDLRLVRTYKPPIEGTASNLAELQVHAAGSPVVHLFTDHREHELIPLWRELRAAMGLADVPYAP